MTTVHRGEVRDNYEMVVKNLEIFGNTTYIVLLGLHNKVRKKQL